LNELSVPTGALALDDAKRTLKAFVATLQAARKCAPDMAFYAHENVRNLSIGDSYPVASLRNQPDCREESQYLTRLQDLAPMKLSLLESEAAAEIDFQYFCLDPTTRQSTGVEAQGLGLAHFFDGACVSFDYNPDWRREDVELLRQTIDAALAVTETEVSARNFSEDGHVTRRSEWLASFCIPEQVEAAEVTDGGELWARREELFPNLKFIPRTESQIKSLLAGQDLFRQVYSLLLKLDAAIEAWDPSTQKAPPYSFKERPESPGRIEEGTVSFQDADGYTRTFSSHVYVAPPPHRIHWLVETAPKKIALVGHVGRKLGIG
jgi:hypothetical protein